MVAQSEPYESPAIRAFAIVLSALQERTGLTRTEVAETLGYTPQLIGQLMSAKNIPSKNVSEDMDTFFKTGDLFVQLKGLISDTRHLTAIPPGLSKYVELEGEATRLSAFEALLIPELLQTEAYARAVIGSLTGPGVVDEAVKARMARKEIFDREKSPRVLFVIDEWALKRMVGSPEITKEQLAFLIETSERPNVIIQVLPYDTELYGAVSGSFTILGFDHGPDIVHIEAAGQGNLITASSSVTNCATQLDLIRGHAYSMRESRRAIHRAVESR